MSGATPPHLRLKFGTDRRIGTQAEFLRLLRSGARRSFFGFTFMVASGAAGPARLGILMSRKVSHRANVRNRVKRCIREAFRLEQPGLAPIDILVRPPQNITLERDLVARLRTAFAALSP